MKSEFIIYTAIFGRYDNLIDPKNKFPNCDFVCFTDQKHLSSNIWNIKYIDSTGQSAVALNRYYKMMPHLHFEEYKHSMYIDANVRLLSSPHDLIGKYLSEYNIACPSHEHRNCIYLEAIECIKRGKAPQNIVEAQMEFYRTEGFPLDFGLREMNVILRVHNDSNVIHLMEEWWKQFNFWSKRDQLSFFYVVWKNSATIGKMSETTRNINRYFFLEMHINNEICNFKKNKRAIKKTLKRFIFICLGKIIDYKGRI